MSVWLIFSIYFLIFKCDTALPHGFMCFNTWTVVDGAVLGGCDRIWPMSSVLKALSWGRKGSCPWGEVTRPNHPQGVCISAGHLHVEQKAGCKFQSYGTLDSSIPLWTFVFLTIK